MARLFETNEMSNYICKRKAAVQRLDAKRVTTKINVLDFENWFCVVAFAIDGMNINRCIFTKQIHSRQSLCILYFDFGIEKR